MAVGKRRQARYLRAESYEANVPRLSVHTFAMPL